MGCVAVSVAHAEATAADPGVIMMTECVVHGYGPLSCATLAMHGPFDQMPAAFGTVYGRLQAAGHVPQGMPVAVYLNDPAVVAPADAVWELRAPIEDGAQEYGPDDAGFAIKRIPAMTVAAVVHQGPYDEVGPAHGRLMAWIAERGLVVVGPPMEAYLNDPASASPDQYLTEIMVPVRSGTTV